MAQIRVLLTKASERERLFILLALNCGMTQKGISDLKPGEVNWEAGTIERKRSKTSKLASTPTVTYKLWPETLDLMKRQRSQHKDHVFLNSKGNPYWSDALGAEGKYRKTDVIGKRFRELRDDCDIDNRLSFINLKKTSRSLLEDHKEHRAIAELFVGRTPQSVSEKHYARPPVGWLAEATDWLRGELGIEGCLER